MAVIHDWHAQEFEKGKPGAYKNVEPLFRIEEDGALYMRFIDQQGKIFSVALTQEEGDRLAEFLWTERK